MTKKAFIQTYGCQMNEHDSQRMAKVLESSGFEMTDAVEEASIVLVNTCSVRENPENKVYSLLGRLRAMKMKNPSLVIGVGGCVAQQEGKAILKREKTVDMVFGPDHYFRLPEMLEAVARGERVLMLEQHASESEPVNFIPEEWMEQVAIDGCRGYIAIMKGCNNFCSFCIVPHVRGREISRELDNILDEARRMADQGVREIWLLGQNVNSYTAGDAGFYELLDATSQLDGLKRIRFTSPHPKDWNDRLTDLMAARPAICNQLHLPFQAGSDSVLEAMRRKHTIEDFLKKVRYMQKVNPAMELSTDIIVGFPGETEEDFQGTLRVLEEVRFGQVFSFKYSVRPGTGAAKLEDDVPRDVKEDRLARVIALQERINEEQLAAYVGTTQHVMIESAHQRKQGVMNGRADNYRPVSVEDDGLNIGDFVNVRITGHHNHWLQGDICEA